MVIVPQPWKWNRKNVNGVAPTKVGLSLGAYNFKAMWLA
jgi:hypothetical protein